MEERFAQRITREKAVLDTRLLGDFCAIYCRGRHAGRDRRALASDGVAAGVYSRIPKVCNECAELLRYAEKRRAYCPKDPKPFCSYCDTHCYRADMRESMREVMRYAGPRSMFHGHAVDGLRHLIEGRRAAARAKAAAPDSEERPL